MTAFQDQVHRPLRSLSPPCPFPAGGACSVPFPLKMPGRVFLRAIDVRRTQLAYLNKA